MGDEWEKKPYNPFRTWREAFTPGNQSSLQEKVEEDGRIEWVTWDVPTPPLPGEPGDGSRNSLLELSWAMVKWLIAGHPRVQGQGSLPLPPPPEPSPSSSSPSG